MAEMLMAAPYNIETEVQFEGRVEPDEELLFPKLDGILFPTVVANADVIAPCPWMGGAEVSLTVALNNYYQVMTEENADVVIADVQAFLAGQIIRQEDNVQLQILEPIPMLTEPEITTEGETQEIVEQPIDTPLYHHEAKPQHKPVAKEPEQERRLPESVVPKTEPIVEQIKKPVEVPVIEPPLLEKVEKTASIEDSAQQIVPNISVAHEELPVILVPEAIEPEAEPVSAFIAEDDEGLSDDVTVEPDQPDETAGFVADMPVVVQETEQEVVDPEEEIDDLYEGLESDKTADTEIEVATDASLEEVVAVETIDGGGQPVSEIDEAIEKIEVLLAGIDEIEDADDFENLGVLYELVDIIGDVSGNLEMEDPVEIFTDDEKLTQTQLEELYMVLLYSVPPVKREELAYTLTRLTLEPQKTDKEMDDSGEDTADFASRVVQGRMRGLASIVRTIKKLRQCVVAMGRSALRLGSEGMWFNNSYAPNSKRYLGKPQAC